MNNIPQIIFDISKVEVVPIDTVHPNTWNPKDEDTVEYGRIRESIRQHGQRKPIAVRENNGYEIIDGEQRWRILKELGSEQVLIYNEGDLSDQEAIELTIAYEQQVPFNDIELATLVKELTESYEDVQLPYSNEQVEQMIQLLDFNWNQPYPGDTGDPKVDPDEGWVEVVLKITEEAQPLIMAEFARVGETLALADSIPDPNKLGLILEIICQLSNQVDVGEEDVEKS